MCLKDIILRAQILLIIQDLLKDIIREIYSNEENILTLIHNQSEE